MADGGEGTGERIPHGARLVAAVHHAVRAFLVAPRAVGLPIRFFHQFPERCGIAFAEQVARALPAEYRPRRIAPRRAMIRLVPGKEVEEQAGLAERPAPSAFAACEYIPEQLPRPVAREEMLLFRRPFIGIAG